jgi:hypothetical protein
MQTNNSFVKIIRKQQSEQLNNKPKSKANKPKRDQVKRDWK